jgi:hypothetical protein
MERIFHQNQLLQLAEIPPVLDGQSVRLHRSHLWLSATIAEQCFGGERQAYVVYYPKAGSLLMAPMSDDAFKQLHDCSLFMLKDRNLKGDKAIALHEVLIDHDLNDEDRELAFSSAPGLRMLQVRL